MALSNIIKEPRREITESIIGIAALSAYVTVDYLFGVWFANNVHTNDSRGFLIFIGMLGGVVASIGLMAFVFATHAMGDGICNFLARNGMDPRPTRRPR